MAETKLSGQATNIIRRNDNGTISTVNNQIIISGYGYITGGNATAASEAISFGVTFASVPIVVASTIGYYATGGGDRYGSTTLNTFPHFYANPQAIDTSGFWMQLARTDGSTLQSTNDFYYSWIAIGELA